MQGINNGINVTINNGVAGGGQAQGAGAAQQSQGPNLLEKLFDPLGILPKALNPGNHLKMLAGGGLGALLGGGK